MRHPVEREKVLGSLMRTAYSRLEVPPNFHLPWSIFFVLYCGFLIWCWVTWLKPKPKVLQNRRAAILLVGLLRATLSTTLAVYLYVHALYTGGYPFDHPVELMSIRWGALAALLGIVAAIVSKGRGRTPLAMISVLNLVFWFAAGMAQ
jgi:fluoride ion exporter CrcB/FEX